MPKNAVKIDDPVFVVKLQKGLADRQRLPLDHVIRVLEEVRQMVADAGREIQRDMGIDRATAEFGLEILAGADGVVFRKGSIQARVAITSNVQAGVQAATRIVETIDSLGKKKYAPTSDTDRTIIRRLNRIARIQETDKTEMSFAIKRPGRGSRAAAATFGQKAIAAAFSLQAPVFQMEDATVFGKLYELKDTDKGEEGEKGFWGELRRENGEIWRIQFGPSNEEEVGRLFRKQVQVTGVAKFYRIAAPKLVVKRITVDVERDYETAFDELFGCDKKLYPADIKQAIREMRGDD